MIGALCVAVMTAGLFVGTVGGCGTPALPNLLPIRLDQLAALLEDESLTDEQRAERLRELGITDELLIEFLLSFGSVEEPEEPEEPDEQPQVLMETNFGDIVMELDDDAAPITVANFLQYVEDGFYDGDDGLGATIFHRIATNPAVIQGGGYTEEYLANPGAGAKDTRDAIVSEADNGLTNDRGTVAMARAADPDSATSQFYINVQDNDFLNGDYTVFGRVIQGLDVVDDIAGVPVDGETPTELIVIERATVLQGG
jgi:peptidyl-prolyl cis-trans isomerase B (cyclophilin B)